MRRISCLHSTILISPIVSSVLRSYRNRTMTLLIPTRSSGERNTMNGFRAYKQLMLFKNGMRESQQKNDVSLRIKASEEATLMDLLKFMYGNTNLSSTSAPELVDLLIAADKFEVTSCMRYCIEMLLKLPMLLESALFYLELPSSVLVSEIVKPLIDAAKQYVATHFKDFTKSQEEAMTLPLSAVEVVLGSEGLKVNSEDDVFDYILKWAHAHYPELEERQEILTKRLVRLICLPNMSSPKLREVLACPDFGHEQVSKLVMEALFSKVEISCWQQSKASKDLATTDCGFSGRVYMPHCVVYFDLKRDELKNLPWLGPLKSPSFYLGGKSFYLGACRSGRGQQHLSLVVCKEPGQGTCTMDFEFEVMNKSSKKFISMQKANCLPSTDVCGMANLLEISWADLMSDNEYYINDILYIRAEITLNSSKA